jgi:hypothetical protein
LNSTSIQLLPVAITLMHPSSGPYGPCPYLSGMK